MFLGDPMIAVAALVATLIALPVFGLVIRANREEKTRGSTPLRVYGFVYGCLAVFVVMAFWASSRWAFASYLTMILMGMFAGSWLAYFAFRHLLERRVGRRDDA